MPKHKIGSTTRPYNQLGFSEACVRIAKAGYSDVAVFAHDREIPVDSGSSQEQVSLTRTAAADAGLDASMILGRTHLELGLDAAIGDYKKLIDNAASLGVKWILELGTAKQEQYEDYPKLMQAVAGHADSAGIGISLKPHGGISLTAQELIDLHDQVGHPAFRISYDPGNIIYYTQGEVRPESEVEMVASRTSTLIIKDCSLDGDKPDVMVTAGDGLVDFPFVIEKMQAGGFVGPMYVECVGSTDPGDVDADLKRTHAFISGLIG
ncbi:MAG: TIM barrel protein [Candidatus Latescibacterota bacterium]|nr:TIM barrel protein [Candidatus Latescibacterota bacterium]